MESLNLVEILKDVPLGTKLYSVLYGEVSLDQIKEDTEYPIRVRTTKNEPHSFTKDGYWDADYSGERVLFPSKENRDWSTFMVKNDTLNEGNYVRAKNHRLICKITDICIAENCYTGLPVTTGNEERIPIFGGRDCFEKTDHFDITTLRPFDKVLVLDGVWEIDFFSRFDENENMYTMNRTGFYGSDIVPYNEDTKHLVGTNLGAPEFYKM